MILLFVAIGVYAVNNSVFDLYLLPGIGVAVYFLECLDFPGAPIILGVILGPVAESRLSPALTISGRNPVVLVQPPVSMIVVAQTVLILAKPLRDMWKQSRSPSA